MTETKPIPEGLRRYPHTGGYYPDLSASDTQPDLDLPCKCTSTCEPRCAGECGCPACSMQFTEFCDVAGLLGGSVPEEEALQRYRGG